MLQHICKVMRKAIRWAEACPCHEGLLYGEDYDVDDSDDDDERVPQRIRAAANTCPFRGRRAPELATGDLVEFVGKIHTQVAADVLLDIPSSLDDEDRKAIMQDYDRARIFFVSVLTLKMAHWGELPFSCFGIGHHDKSKAFASYQRAMGSDSCHPLVTTLKSNRFEEDRAIYEEHKGHLELVPYEEPAMYRKTQAPHMRAYIAKLKVTPTAERPVEATHAVIHKEVRRAPNHSFALASLANRFPLLLQELLSEADSFVEFATTFAAIRNARKAVELLGLGSHPSSLRVPDKRSKYHWAVIYRGDDWSKYTMQTPVITTTFTSTVAEALPRAG